MRWDYPPLDIDPVFPSLGKIIIIIIIIIIISIIIIIIIVIVLIIIRTVEQEFLIRAEDSSKVVQAGTCKISQIIWTSPKLQTYLPFEKFLFLLDFFLLVNTNASE